MRRADLYITVTTVIRTARLHGDGDDNGDDINDDDYIHSDACDEVVVMALVVLLSSSCSPSSSSSSSAVSVAAVVAGVLDVNNLEIHVLSRTYVLYNVMVFI